MMGPIPWSSIDRYAGSVLGFGYEDEVPYEDFRHAIRGCDEAFLEVQHQKAKRSRKG